MGDDEKMTPAEASAIDFEEPDWRERFEEHCLRWPQLPRWQQEDRAFEETLRDWRRFHWTPIGDKRQPADAVKAIIALAELRIFPPRFTINDVPRDGMTGYQHDDHCWLQIAGEQWRIVAIEDRTLLLERMDGETKQIDLNKAKWTKYCEAAAATLLIGPS
jgi:hypothetical protein